MADNAASVGNRATLSTLPLEIKARICELAALQDELYKERWIPGAPGEKLVKVHKNEWRGRSLAAMSETSKEFNELAAKHIFHTLIDTQIDSIMFTLIVQPKHTSRVRRVNIIKRRPAGQDVRPVFAALPLLPNLSDLGVSHDALSKALGDLSQEPSGIHERMLRDAFRTVARRLHTVALVNFPTLDDVVAFTVMCQNLQDLSISGTAVVDGPQRLGEHLSTIPTLERLVLDAAKAGSQGLHLPSGWPTLTSLASLTLLNVELEANGVALINQHALTLRHLALQLPDDSPPTPPPGFPIFSPLPSLSSFTLYNSSSTAYKAIITALAIATSTSTTRTTSRLSHLNVELTDDGVPFETGDLRASLKPYRKLRSLCITGLAGDSLSLRVVGSLD